MRTIYCDHAATTPVDPRVADAMRPFFGETFGNPSSVHSFGRMARQALEESREKIAALVGARPAEIIFTSGGTEADNLAVAGAFSTGKKKGRVQVVVGAGDHHAVLDSAAGVVEEGGGLAVIPLDAHGHVIRDELTRHLGGATALVSLIHANNEVGTIEDIPRAAEAAHRVGALMHTDAVQSFGKIPIDVRELGVDLLSLSAHKLYGPKGIGALYIHTGTELGVLFRGGGQERGRRPGTENVPLAVGFATAARLALEGMEEESKRLRELRDALEKGIRDGFPEVIVNGDGGARLPHILNVAVDSRKRKVEGEMLVVNMDLKGIAVSSGSACTSGSVQPSHVLLAMGRDEETARAALRFSFGRENRAEEIPVILAALKEILQR
jgi:cysteine desulfurase